MSEDKPKPVDDLKEGLGLLFRAAKGAVESAKGAVEGLPLPSTDKIESAAKDAAKEVSRAFESLGKEVEKVMGKSPSQPAAHPPTAPETPVANTSAAAEPKEAPKYDDGYAPEPPKGPRVG